MCEYGTYPGADRPAAQERQPGEGADVQEAERALLPAGQHLQGQGGQGENIPTHLGILGF